MSTRKRLCERLILQIYGGKPTDDAEITPNQVNEWLNDAVAAAAKSNYRENIQLESTAYVNGAFHMTYSDLPVVRDYGDDFLYKVQLPHIPVAIGIDQGVGSVRFRKGYTSFDAIPLNNKQSAFASDMRTIPNKILYSTEGKFLFLTTTIQLNEFTARVRMISGGDSKNMDSEVNVPDDYMPEMILYINKMLATQRSSPVDLQNDGRDLKK
ncbi:MAG TPA: hypothetical protein VK625_03895 [Flavitalea sp.]|nr:hypothetical protein [Flavitalea sp.]